MGCLIMKTEQKKDYDLKIGQVTLKLTNQDKIYWPDEKITKGDLLNYYTEIAPVILPYLKDRPQSLHRYPNGIQGKSFFQKDVGRQPPPAWVQTAVIASE